MRRLTQGQYLDRARTVHGELYEYDKLIYKTARDKVIISCKVHGNFAQRAYCHLNGQGCPECSHNIPLTSKEYSNKSHLLFGERYEVDQESFKGTKHPVRIKCIDHGWFIHPCADRHLKNNGGCPTCVYHSRVAQLKPGKISKLEREWLDSLNVSIRQHRIVLNNKIFVVDGFDPVSNTIYECYGVYWHGAPTHFDAAAINPTLQVTFGSLYEKTISREELLQKAGYKIVSLWI